MGRHYAEMVHVVGGDEKRRTRREIHQHKVAQMIEECGGKSGSLAQNLQAYSMEGRERRSW